MVEKRILGLDLGTNSIGWALVEQDFSQKQGEILGLGSRIIPMSQDIINDFGKGNSKSQTADRTGFRGVRRLRERHLLRRERLHRVLNIMNFLPEHYAQQIDFTKRFGKFKKGTEPKLAYNGSDFIFKESFKEMLEDFKKYQPQLLEGGKLVPYDWTIYYLRKKALSKKILKEELAWIILNFNQKRGYYQLRGEEEEENPNKLVEFHSLKIVDVIADDEINKKGETWYSLQLENGWVYRRSSKTSLEDWKDKVRDFIVTTDLNDDGTIKTDKEGQEKRSFRAPKEDDWTLVKKKTEQEIEATDKNVGAYIYDSLLKDPSQKIIGKLVRTIERKFYKNELKEILRKQIELQPELFSDDLYIDCVRELYKSNEAHQQIISNRDFEYLFVEDIIFYQRPLRSQKSLIATCPLEYRYRRVVAKDDKGIPINGTFEKDKDGNYIKVKEYLKVIPKSHPLYQEFRLWQWIYNLKIHTKEDDKDVTAEFIQTTEDLVNVFDFLCEKKEIKQDALIKFILQGTGLKGKALSEEFSKYRWNYVEDKGYPCFETRYLIQSSLSKVEGISPSFLTTEIELHLWHIIYSVTDKIEFEKALGSFAKKYNIDSLSFVESFKRIPPYKSEYGAYSEKAIRKLLPLMRVGKYWDFKSIDNDTKERIDKILTGEFDETIKDRVREKSINLSKVDDFQGLQLWLAQYIVYDRHSEAEVSGKWNSVTDLDKYIANFKQHSLRNPIVEQVVSETLRVVRDIWLHYGKGEEGYFDEIHVELGREMKNTSDARKRITNQITENENTNLRIKLMLVELMNDGGVENVRPHSPSHQEILKIYEEGAINSDIEVPDDILRISKLATPSKSEFQRYKLWLEQKYKSPYTGQIIPLSRLFTEDYQIEHVIPQSRLFNDSYANKVICESAVNQLKDKQLGFEFIKNHQGQIVEVGFGKKVKILSESEYETFVKAHYKSNRHKRLNLLMDEVPEEMISRQMNDTRYISKFVSNILSNIVRSETNDDGINSKNILPGNGRITTQLKRDWGLNDVWNNIVLPRFERMNEVSQSKSFTAENTNGKIIPNIPIELSKGFSKKRIDHRHHAMDALVVACTTRSHVSLLNNESAGTENKRYELQRTLRKIEKWVDRSGKERTKFTEFIKPWDSFTQDAQKHLESIVISFKQNLRIINKATNNYEKFVDGKKVLVKQKGVNWAIRKPMHKETVSGLIKLRKIKSVSLNNAFDIHNDIVDKDLRKYIQSLIELGYDKKKLSKHFKDQKNIWKDKNISRVDVYYWEENLAASRVTLDTSFSKDRIEKSVADSVIQKILLAHLKKYEGVLDDKNKKITPELLAFTPEGIDEMNKKIISLNKGKFHQPIYKVRTYETMGNKFPVGETGNKKDKYVEAAKGTNLFYAIYADEEGKRSFETIPLNVVIERQKQGLASVPETNEKGDQLLFHLSPNDLVYVPEESEVLNGNLHSVAKEKVDRIYKMVSSTGRQCFFIMHHVATSIVDKVEFSALNKLERSIDGGMVKENCIKLNVDRLGNIK